MRKFKTAMQLLVLLLVTYTYLNFYFSKKAFQNVEHETIRKKIKRDEMPTRANEVGWCEHCIERGEY